MAETTENQAPKPNEGENPKPAALKDNPEAQRSARRARVQEVDSAATPEQNAALEHSRGGATTRQDVNDLGVPMLPGSPRERVGPEDALGAGPKRGDYRRRLGGADYAAYTFEPIPDDERERDEHGNVTGPATRRVAQTPRAAEIADEEAMKGGVDTDPRADMVPRA